MLRLSKKADYALIAMNHLARKQGSPSASTSARDIAERYDIPIELMAKVLQRLVRTGLLISTQGTRGGYMLSRAASSISVVDVIQAIDGPFTITACSTERHNCDQYSKCNVRGPLWQIRERIVTTLGTVSLAEMARESEPAPVAAEVAVVRRSGVSASAGHGPRQG
jgi:FeS assembly SUF system regulator